LLNKIWNLGKLGNRQSAEKDGLHDEKCRHRVGAKAPAERAPLELQLLADEAYQEGFVIWQGHGALLDGPRRLAIRSHYGLSFRTVELPFVGRAEVRGWILPQQSGERNPTPLRLSYLRGKRSLSELHRLRGDRRDGSSITQIDHLHSDPLRGHDDYFRTDSWLARAFCGSGKTNGRASLFPESLSPKRSQTVTRLNLLSPQLVRTHQLGFAFHVIWVTAWLLWAGAFVSPPHAFAAPCTPKSKSSNSPSRAKILRLLKQLGDPKASTRATAYRELLRIGPPVTALTLRREWLGNDLRALPLLLKLLADIQSKHGIQPTRVNGLEFLPIMDLTWRAPAPGSTRDIKMALKLTNRRSTKLYLALFNKVSVTVGTPKGKSLQVSGGRDSPGHWGGQNTGPLSQGQSYTVSLFAAKLCRSADGKDLWLQGEDGWIGFFKYNELKLGRYFVRFMVRNQFRLQLKDGTPEWEGVAWTTPVAVEIR
jgi:hypothetical protein